MASANQTSKALASAPVDQAEIDALMRRFFIQGRGDVRSGSTSDTTSGAEPTAAPRRDFDMASELLDRAADAFDFLMSRCQTLERDLQDVSERAQTQAAEQEDTIEQWKRLASGLKAQIDASEQASTAMKQRCDAAEERAAMAEQRASALERASAQAAAHAATADQLSTKLHDKVVSAFGLGSRAHPVLEAMATRVAVE